MATFNNDQLNRLFPRPVAIAHATNSRTYDVRITLNKSGVGKANVVRFGFINNAAKALGKFQFIEASDIEYTKNRVYFRCHNEKLHRNVHTLSTNAKSRENGCYFSITPTAKAEKAYRMNWIGKTYDLLYDADNDLYYIENNSKED